MASIYPIAGFLLAGGRSSRMGEDKALIEVSGQTLMARSVGLLKSVCESCTLIGPKERYASLGLDVEIIEDAVEPCGPLGGILTGLRHSKHEYALFLACDLPFMTERFLRYLVGAAMVEKPDIAVPVDGSGEYQPLCTVYSRACLPAVESSIAAKRYKVSSFYDSLGKLRVIGTGEIRHFSPDFKIFTNVNTPEELLAARKES
ncbi:MAG: molybdenum cofactor guanylyltransferase [Acidobacteriia bacterium]|nr:molybdenum cofactor guanylyltransferase [Terriglobia bacterium]